MDEDEDAFVRCSSGFVLVFIPFVGRQTQKDKEVKEGRPV